MIAFLKAKFTDKTHLPPEWPAKEKKVRRASDVEAPWVVMTEEEYENHRKYYLNDFLDFCKKEQRIQNEINLREEEYLKDCKTRTKSKLLSIGFKEDEIKMIMGKNYVQE